MLTSCNSDLKKPTRAMFAIPNSLAPRCPPINKLPPELLISIFRLIIDGQPRGLLDDNTLETLPIYPDIFSHVCSRWRQTTLEFPTFWIGIQLSLSASTWKWFLARAKLFVSRTCQLPLDVYVDDNLQETVHEIDNTNFLFNIATRIRSLWFSTRSRPHPEHNNVLQTIFLNCTPGTLTEVTLLDVADFYPLTFIQAFDNRPYGSNNIILSVADNDLDSLWLSVTSLRVGGIYPRWSSKAYHGLVELHLLAWSNDPPTISVAELTSVLKSSPGLRILHIDLLVTEAELFSSDTPVRLEHLEILNLGGTEYDDIEPLIRVIAPGPKALEFSFSDSDSPLERLSSNPEVVKFFQRSNIERLHVNYGRYTLFEDAFRLAPRLQVMALEYLELVGPSLHESGVGVGNFCAPETLHTIYILQCHSTQENFRKLAQLFPTQTLIVWRCNLIPAPMGSDHSNSNPILSISGVQREWDSIFSSRFKVIVSDEPSPIKGWGHML
ncbi:unnamed protein product [Rhizoctonia solani]|uniref:F-box domain-containing protein n=1 Tax=Rhizoctonia solani TaxID=456999 RepID=A0A8H3CEH4_9AGAM|nr:unnamed protein product [Rhizoctonia solani]